MVGIKEVMGLGDKIYIYDFINFIVVGETDSICLRKRRVIGGREESK